MRAPDTRFLYRHRFLHMLWSADLKRAFLTMTYSQQRALHDFYRPAEDLTDAQLAAHLATITKDRPTLAPQAGKAYRKIERTFLHATEVADGDGKILHRLLRQKEVKTVTAPDRRGRRIVVSGLARPVLDTKAIARVILQVAKDQVAREAAEAQPTPEPATLTLRTAARESAAQTPPPAAPSAGSGDLRRSVPRPRSVKHQRRTAPQQLALDLD